jgi:hypothetical protein
MSLTITQATFNALQSVNIEPKIVLEIEGLSEVFGSRIISTRVRVGDNNLFIGDDWVIGGTRETENQNPFISLDSKTTTTIRQQLQPDKGIGSSISSMQVSLVDLNGKASMLVSPGKVIDDILGARCKVYLGFKDVAFPDDYVVIFRGVVDSIDASAGSITLQLSHPDQKKRQQILPKAKVEAIGQFSLSMRTTNGSTLVDSTDTSLLLAGMGIMGNGIQAGSVIANIVSGTSFNLDKTATVGATETRTVLGFSGATSIVTVTDPNAFVYQNHAASNENGLNTYLKLDNEFIEIYQRYESNPVWFATRGALGSTVARHLNQEAEVYYRLKGNAIDLALQLMLSKAGGETPYDSYAEDIAIGSIVKISATESVANALWFPEVDLVKQYGIRKGDIVHVTEASATANLVTTSAGARIAKIEVRYNGTMVVLDETVSLVEETETPAVCYFTSQYNVLGFGLGMKNDEVDIDEHERIKRLFLSSFEVELMVKDSENAKDLIEKELYAPAGAYSLPRKGQASLGMHIGPIPGAKTKVLNKTTIKRPSEIVLRRSLANNFANTIIYKYDYDFQNDQYLSGIVSRNETSAGRIKVGTRALVFESRGMRSSLNAGSLANAAANRRLDRYKFGAEYLENIRVSFKFGFDVEIGDLVILDTEGLNILNSEDGSRKPRSRFFEVINRSLDIRTGDISLSIVDTTFDTANRYGLISPASKIKAGLSEKSFIIKPSFNTDLTGVSEGLKWSRFVTDRETVRVRVRSIDGSLIGESLIESVAGNTINLVDDLGFVPSENDLLEMAVYDSTNEVNKLLYVHISDEEFSDGKSQYLMG